MNNIAFLELKYGNIYGGYPNYFVVSDISLLVYEPDTNKIFLESMPVNIDLNIVFVNTKVNELGHTTGRLKYVANLRSRKKMRFDEEFKLNERDLDYAFTTSRRVKTFVKGFLLKTLNKYRVNQIVTFDGRRDIFLCEKAGINFDRVNIFDLQRALNKECNYLFSLNKLSVITNFNTTPSSLNSNNISYYLHPIAAKQIRPKSAAYDAARLLMVHQEFFEHKDDFLMKAALLLNKIQTQQAKEKEAKAAAEALKAEQEQATVSETSTETEAPSTTEEVTVETTEDSKES